MIPTLLLLVLMELPGTYDQLMTRLEALSAPEHQAQLHALFDALKDKGKIPFVAGERVVFLYRETEEDRPVNSVHWVGDFNRWRKTDPYKGVQLGKSGVWRATASFPKNARLDYKVVINGGKWMIDEANPRQQVGGYGPNSVLAMPDWRPSPWVVRKDGVPRGSMTSLTASSKIMGYDVACKVYTPAGYTDKGDDGLHVIYVTDGQDYAHNAMGSMVIVLDNLIAEKKIPPVIAVFIDPRNVKSKDNRRETEYAKDYVSYARFIAEELVPSIDGAYRTIETPKGRMIMGTSLGGIFTSYMGIAHADTFALIATHSPAMWLGKPVVELYRSRKATDTRHFILTGTIGDVLESARELGGILKEKGYTHKLLEVNDGHSWGNWRAHLDDTLIYLLE
ncbi:MAG: alpha/beta hydrolase-fold protein [Acidobacteriota bacterium]|nr:alpha/beta hydrolase-fold protein [Acidobacteriota bacterium]